MDQAGNQNTDKTGGGSETTPKKTITTTIKCQFCGKNQEVTVEIPESEGAPKMAWQG